MPQPPLLCYRLDRAYGAGCGAAPFDIFAFARSKAGAAAKIAKELWHHSEVKELFDEILVIRSPDLDHVQVIHKPSFVFAGYSVECDNQGCFEAVDSENLSTRSDFVYCSESCADADERAWADLVLAAARKWPWTHVHARARGHTPACQNKDTGKEPRLLVLAHSYRGGRTLYCQSCRVLASNDPSGWRLAKGAWELRGQT